MENVLIIIGAAALIIAIIWWFFGKRTATTKTAQTDDNGTQNVTVVVNGGYTPNTVVLQQGVPAQIVFERKDPSGCFNEVVFPDFGIQTELPIGTEHPVTIDTSKAGEFHYACGMNMFHGKVVIK